MPIKQLVKAAAKSKQVKRIPKNLSKQNLDDLLDAARKEVDVDIDASPKAKQRKIKLTPQQQLDEFIEAEQLRDFKTTKLTIKGKEVDVALSPYTAEELMPRIEKLIILRQLADPDVAQPRRGWQKIFGNVIGEDGWPIDFGGGRGETATKKGSSKPLYIRSTKGANERHFRETLFPVDQRQLAERRKFRDVPEKHHIYHLIGSMPFGMMRDASGKLVKRSAEQLERVAQVMRNKYGIYVGDQDWNEVMLSRPAHTGLQTDKLSKKFAAHGSVQGATDAQGPGKIVKGKNVEVFEGGHTLPGTYEAGQGHGFSKEFLEQLYKLETDEDVVRAMKEYYDIHSEPLKGSAALAGRLDKTRGLTTDPMSKQILEEALPEETRYLQGLETLPQYQAGTKKISATPEELDFIQRAKAEQFQEGVNRQGTTPVKGQGPAKPENRRSLFAVDGNSR